MKSNIKINKQRLIDSIEEMAKIGKTPKGGVNRQALTDLDKISRDLFINWCKKEKLQITIDKMGNIFARRSGKNNKILLFIYKKNFDRKYRFISIFNSF